MSTQSLGLLVPSAWDANEAVPEEKEEVASSGPTSSSSSLSLASLVEKTTKIKREIGQASVRVDLTVTDGHFRSRLQSLFARTEETADLKLSIGSKYVMVHKAVMFLYTDHFLLAGSQVTVKNVAFSILVKIVRLIYLGADEIHRDDLPALLVSARMLGIAGIFGFGNGERIALGAEPESQPEEVSVRKSARSPSVPLMVKVEPVDGALPIDDSGLFPGLEGPDDKCRGENFRPEEGVTQERNAHAAKVDPEKMCDIVLSDVDCDRGVESDDMGESCAPEMNDTDVDDGEDDSDPSWAPVGEKKTVKKASRISEVDDAGELPAAVLEFFPHLKVEEEARTTKKRGRPPKSVKKDDCSGTLKRSPSPLIDLFPNLKEEVDKPVEEQKKKRGRPKLEKPPKVPKKRGPKPKLDSDGNPIKKPPKEPKKRGPKPKLDSDGNPIKRVKKRYPGKPREKLPCDICGALLSDKNHLEQHRRLHTGEKIFHCQYCIRSFTHFGTLKRHEKKHTGDLVKCRFCDKKMSASSIKLHERTHSEVREYTCSVCGRGFREKSQLKRHAITHMTVKPFKCQFCERSFADRRDHIKHEKNAHNHSDPALKCDFCDKWFSDRRLTVKHERAVHPEQLVGSLIPCN